MPMTKDMRRAVDDLRKRGYTIQPTAGNKNDHVKIMWQGELVAIAGGGVANSAIHNFMAQVKRFEKQRADKQREADAIAAKQQQKELALQNGHAVLGTCGHDGCTEPAFARLADDSLVCWGHLLAAYLEEAAD